MLRVCIYLLVTIPQHIDFPLENGGNLGPFLENVQHVNVFLTVVILGWATAIGFACRWAARWAAARRTYRL